MVNRRDHRRISWLVNVYVSIVRYGRYSRLTPRTVDVRVLEPVTHIRETDGTYAEQAAQSRSYGLH